MNRKSRKTEMTAATIQTVADLKRAFPDLALIGTGGNCTALEMTCKDRILSITAADGEPHAPLDTDSVVTFSQDDEDGPLEHWNVQTVAEVAAFLARVQA